MSEQLRAAWELTRRMATRRYVRTMIADVDGRFTRNSYPRMFPVAGHMPPNSPWVIELADDDLSFRYAVFDLDAKTDDAFEQAAEDLGTVVRVLRAAALPHVVCRSSTTGGFHVWVPLAGASVELMVELANAAKACLPSLDHGLLRNAAAGAARPPLSPHAKGGFSSVMAGGDPADALISGSVSSEQLSLLVEAFRALRPEAEPQLERAAGEQSTSHRAHRDLPAWGKAQMATIAGGMNPSRTGYLCLLAAATAGWSFSDVEHAARTAPGMEHYRTRNDPTGGPRRPRRPAEAAARLERQWRAAQERVRLNTYAPAASEPKDLSELTGILRGVSSMLDDLSASPGRWSRSESAFHDASLLAAIAWLSLRSGQSAVSASLRSLALITGIPSTTVHRRLRALAADGLIACTRESDRTDAAVWRLAGKFSTAPVHDGPHHKTTARPPGAVFDERSVLLADLQDRITAGAHDVFTRAGLGPTARRAYESLSPDTADEATVAERSGLPLSRARVALARLRRHRLIVGVHGQWRRRKNDLRGSVARALGVDAVLQRRAQRYSWEREQWAWWNAELVFRAGRTPKQRRRPDPKQGVMFRLVDRRGDDRAWPAYPRDSSERPDHLAAVRFVMRGVLQQLRDVELAV